MRRAAASGGGGAGASSLPTSSHPSTSTPAASRGAGPSAYARLSCILVEILAAFLLVGLLLYIKEGSKEKPDTLASAQNQELLEQTKAHARFVEQEGRDRVAALERELAETRRELHDAKGGYAEALTRAQAAGAAPGAANPEAAAAAEEKTVKRLVSALQAASLDALRRRYGAGPLKIEFETAKGSFVIQTAEFASMPHVIHYFSSLVERGFWDGCGVIRNAAHVMQMNCRSKKNHGGYPSIAFQEFNTTDPRYMHQAFTVGVAGRPGGPDIYMNLLENFRSHGPGGQGPEPDPCWGAVVSGREMLMAQHKVMADEWLPEEQELVFTKVTVSVVAPEAAAAAGAG